MEPHFDALMDENEDHLRRLLTKADIQFTGWSLRNDRSQLVWELLEYWTDFRLEPEIEMMSDSAGSNSQCANVGVDVEIKDEKSDEQSVARSFQRQVKSHEEASSDFWSNVQQSSSSSSDCKQQ